VRMTGKSLPVTQEIQRLVSTRGGMVGVAGAVAVMAGMMLLFFMSQYRQSVDSSSKTVTVLIAKSLIEKGTSGDVIADKGMFETSSLKQSERKTGAIVDPSNLRGQAAADDVFPGEQLTVADFKHADGGVINKISGRERAITLPLDSAHGMVGDVQTGDRVDVLAGFNSASGAVQRPVLKAIMQNALVLRAPSSVKGGVNNANSTQNVVVRAPDDKTWDFAYASEFGKVWIVLRPQAGAENTGPSVVTLETLLTGVKPISLKKLVRRGH
jgi:Flp pilus assembly protein CpaB